MPLHPIINIYNPKMIVVQEGNEAVRQAIQNKASYRVYILFILLVFSFRWSLWSKATFNPFLFQSPVSGLVQRLVIDLLRCIYIIAALHCD